jgi:hypothetical protein
MIHSIRRNPLPLADVLAQTSTAVAENSLADLDWLQPPLREFADSGDGTSNDVFVEVFPVAASETTARGPPGRRRA